MGKRIIKIDPELFIKMLGKSLFIGISSLRMSELADLKLINSSYMPEEHKFMLLVEHPKWPVVNEGERFEYETLNVREF